MWVKQEKFKIKEWRKPPRIRKIPRCCHKLELLKVVKDKWHYYETRQCLRCGIIGKNNLNDCEQKCLSCGEEDWSWWINEKSWLCLKCYRRTKSRKH